MDYRCLEIELSFNLQDGQVWQEQPWDKYEGRVFQTEETVNT